ncbi:hypothetical protein SISNIDRAFT_463191 [Sistotremastrum niveocremeum HHB9708]|uniref:PinX1-related protein 1 n=1 Tax=Sistotremastrum niveocremeum HHB9708 TaxID=1314777 RepID=A0A164YV11_9AGAM|nr:hypothetical protein SISNIDRAFT_463191 [Sistotremastrum niveocremeum HHB9708]
MGLSGRKIKQRIGHDPRNLTWADDAAKFGQSYLEKFGWQSGTGLGSNAEGMKTHLKVMQKLDLMGIGGNRKGGGVGDEGGQGREYEMLLRRLNEAEAEKERKKGEDGKGGSGSGSSSEGGVGEESDTSSSSSSSSGEESESDEEPKPKTKKRKLEEKVEKVVVKTIAPRPMAHRAKFLRSKKLASASTASINEILGISSASASASASASTAPTPLPPASPSPSPFPSVSAGAGIGAGIGAGKGLGYLTPVSDDVDDRKLSTSVKSVADYFKEKMEAKKKAAASPSSMFVSATSAVKTETLETQIKVEPQSEVVPIKSKSEEGDEEETKARVKTEKKEKKKKRKERKVEEQAVDDEEDMKIEAPEIVLADTPTEPEKKKKKKKRDKGENTEPTAKPNAAEKIKTADDHESGEQRSDIKREEGTIGDGDDAETETKRVKKKRKREQSSQ